MERVLLTGATGLVGSALLPLLTQNGFAVRQVVRRAPSPENSADAVFVGSIGTHTCWDQALAGADVVIHLAAAHHMPTTRNNVRMLMETNANGTAALARAAARAGVRRFLYLSTIKVNGENSSQRAFSSRDDPRPTTSYGMSKWLGEKALLYESNGSRMEPIIVRAPLVYGPHVRANFLGLLRLIEAEKTLPLGAIKNERSFVSIWNLTDLIIHVLGHPAATGVWMVSDGVDLSTPELIRRLGAAMRRNVRLINVPAWVLRCAGNLIGRGQQVHSLCDSLKVDISPARQLLGWSPPIGVDNGLERTVRWYLARECAGAH